LAGVNGFADILLPVVGEFLCRSCTEEPEDCGVGEPDGFLPHYLLCSLPGSWQHVSILSPIRLALTLVFYMCLNRYGIDLVLIITLNPKFLYM